MPKFIVTDPNGQSYEVNGPPGATQAQAVQMVQRQLGVPQPPAGYTLDQPNAGAPLDIRSQADKAAANDWSQFPAAPPPPPGYTLDKPGGNYFDKFDPPQNSLAGSGKALGSGLLGAAISAAGTRGDIREAQAAALNKLYPGVGDAFNKVAPFIPGANLILAGPTSQQIRGAVESQTGSLDYQPQTQTEKFLKTAGEFAPGALLPGGVVRKSAQVAIPAIGSELAGQATEGTPAEPYARFAGGLLGGVSEAALGNRLAARAGRVAAPTLADIETARDADYAHVRSMGVTIQPAALQREIGGIRTNLENDGLTQDVAGPTIGVLDRLINRQAPISFTELDNTRKILGNMARGATSPSSMERMNAGAAQRAIQEIDNVLPTLQPSDFASGANRHAEIVQRLANARDNAAAAFRSQALAQAEFKAENNAGAANSGANVENALRQQAKAILNNPARLRGYNQAERDQLQRFVRGEGGRNLIRWVGNLLGGGGGLGMLGTGAAGAFALGPAGLAAPVLGWGIKQAGNAASRRAFNQLDEMVRQRSALGQAGPQPTLGNQTPLSLAALQAMFAAHAHKYAPAAQ